MSLDDLLHLGSIGDIGDLDDTLEVLGRRAIVERHDRLDAGFILKRRYQLRSDLSKCTSDEDVFHIDMLQYYRKNANYF